MRVSTPGSPSTRARVDRAAFGRRRRAAFVAVCLLSNSLRRMVKDAAGPGPDVVVRLGRHGADIGSMTLLRHGGRQVERSRSGPGLRARTATKPVKAKIWASEGVIGDSGVQPARENARYGDFSGSVLRRPRDRDRADGLAGGAALPEPALAFGVREGHARHCTVTVTAMS